jgi:hypothetical protein
MEIPLFEGISTSVTQSAAPLKYAVNCYNFTFKNGALMSGLGVGGGRVPIGEDGGGLTLELPAMPSEFGGWIESMHMYHRFDYETGKRDDRLVVISGSGIPMYVKYFRPNLAQFNWIPINGISMPGKTCSVNYNYDGRDILLISSKNSTVLLDEGDASYVQNSPHFSSLTKHYERVYGTVYGNKRQVWFSDDFNPLNWTVSNTEGGYIDFNDEGGAVIKVVSFSNYLFIFREYEILRLRAFGDQNDFSLSKLFVATGRIFEDTVTIAGDKIMFMADDGVYEFNGETARKVFTDINAFFNLPQVRPSGCYMHGKYYLACLLRFPNQQSTAFLDEIGRAYSVNALVEFDLEKRIFSIMRGVDIYALLAVSIGRDSRIFTLFSDEPARTVGNVESSASYFDAPLEALWQSPESDLGYPGRKKVIRSININVGSRPVTVGISVDGKRYEYEVCGKNRKINVGHGGELVAFSFKSGVLRIGTEINAFSVTFDVV